MRCIVQFRALQSCVAPMQLNLAPATRKVQKISVQSNLATVASPSHAHCCLLLFFPNVSAVGRAVAFDAACTQSSSREGRTRLAAWAGTRDTPPWELPISSERPGPQLTRGSSGTLSSDRQRLSNGGCLGVMREYCQNCPVLCSLLLCTTVVHNGVHTNTSSCWIYVSL